MPVDVMSWPCADWALPSITATTTTASNPIRPPIVRVLRVSYRILLLLTICFVSFSCSAAEKDVRYARTRVQPQTLVLPRFTNYQGSRACPSFQHFGAPSRRKEQVVEMEKCAPGSCEMQVFRRKRTKFAPPGPA